MRIDQLYNMLRTEMEAAQTHAEIQPLGRLQITFTYTTWWRCTIEGEMVRADSTIHYYNNNIMVLICYVVVVDTTYNQ